MVTAQSRCEPCSWYSCPGSPRRRRRRGRRPEMVLGERTRQTGPASSRTPAPNAPLHHESARRPHPLHRHARRPARRHGMVGPTRTRARPQCPAPSGRGPAGRVRATRTPQQRHRHQTAQPRDRSGPRAVPGIPHRPPIATIGAFLPTTRVHGRRSDPASAAVVNTQRS